MARAHLLYAYLLAFGAAACKGHAAAPPTAPGKSGVGGSPAGAALSVTFSAQRCGECHYLMHDEWTPSAHAQSARSSGYTAMRAAAESQRRGAAVGCDRCHAPLRRHTDARDPAAEEGVTCDVCHTIRTVEARPAGGAFTLVTNDNVRSGPLCDARDHYFHRMGCSPLHAEALFCAGCHLYYEDRGATALPIYTEYEEWQASPYAAAGEPCQSCHMPESHDEVARGSPPRDGVPHHGFLGSDGRLRRRALTMKLEVTEREGRLQIAVALANKRAGHRVPTGSPDRRLILRVSTVDPTGAEFARAERVYGRMLADDTGRPAPAFAATRVATDNRLMPRESRLETFDLDAPPGGEVRAQLAYQPIAPDVAGRIPMPVPREELLLEARVAFDAPAPTRRHRGRLPATQVAKVDAP